MEKPKSLGLFKENTETREDIKGMRFDLKELRDITMIRKITKDSYKDLGDLLNYGKKIPIFGYPLICYSPNQNKEDQLRLFFSRGTA